MTKVKDSKELAREFEIDGMVRLSLVELLIDIARWEGKAEAIDKELNEE